MEVTECTKNNLCVDCKDDCVLAGDKVADCPKLTQKCEILKIVHSCYDCTWIDGYVEKQRLLMKGVVI